MGRVERMARRRWALGAGVMAALLGRVSLCVAAETWQEFSWRAPEECPDRELVLHQLEAVRQAHPVELGSVDVRGDIDRSGSGWVLSLDVRVGTERRVRQLSAERCEDLGDAAAVALVLLLTPPSRGGVSEVGAAPDTPAAASVSTAPAAPPPDAAVSVDSVASEPEVDAPPISWQLGGEGVLDSSTLAGAAVGGSVQSRLRRGAWGLGVYGLVLPARRRDVAPGSSVEFSQWAAGLRLCHGVWRGAVQVDGCAGLELGRFSGRGSGLNVTRNEVEDWWLAPSGGAQFTWHALPHAALLGRVEALVPLLKENYVINSDVEVHDTPGLTIRGSLGLEFDLL